MENNLKSSCKVGSVKRSWIWEILPPSLLTTLLLACCYPLPNINSGFILHSDSSSDYMQTNTLGSFGCISPPAANVPLFSCLSHAVADISSPSLTSAASNLPLQDHLPAISDNLGFMLAFKKGEYRCFLLVRHSADIACSGSCKSSRQFSPLQGRCEAHLKGGGDSCLCSETRPPVSFFLPTAACAKSIEMSLNQKNVQECLIWLRPI